MPAGAAHEHAVACGVELRTAIRSSAVWRLLVLLGGEEQLRVYPDMQAGLTGSSIMARVSEPDYPASTAPDVSERYQDALRAARRNGGACRSHS